MDAARLDASDPLASFRDRFHIPAGALYFVGNSLGLQPKTVRAYVEEELKAWETHAVEGHLKG
jgi:kynureninase